MEEIAAGVQWEDLYGQLFERYLQDSKDQQEIILQAVEKSRGQINSRYHHRLNNLRLHWEEEDQQEKLKGELRQLQLSGKYCEAWERLRNLPDTRDPELWEMRAVSTYECGLASGNLQVLEDSVASGQKLLALWSKESHPEQWTGDPSQSRRRPFKHWVSKWAMQSR